MLREISITEAAATINQYLEMSIQSINATLQHRRAGFYHLNISSRPGADYVNDYRELLDGYVSDLGFNKIGKGWVEIDRRLAVMILVDVLHRDMAYDHEVMNLRDANFAAEAFVQLFVEKARFFTNGSRGNIESVERPNGLRIGPSWNPITNATFDAGVVAFDGSQIGLLWVEDED